jgi:hypothetical protein
MSATATKSAKTVCPVSRTQSVADAQPVTITINGQSYVAEVKEFSTDSLGWCLSGKVTIQVSNVRVPCQLGMNLTAIGSKELPK